jgi:hypothetical protein
MLRSNLQGMDMAILEFAQAHTPAGGTVQLIQDGPDTLRQAQQILEKT